MKVTPHFKLEEVSPLPLVRSELQVELRASDSGAGRGQQCVEGQMWVWKHQTEVLDILNTFLPDFPGALPCSLLFLWDRIEIWTGSITKHLLKDSRHSKELENCMGYFPGAFPRGSTRPVAICCSLCTVMSRVLEILVQPPLHIHIQTSSRSPGLS